MSTAIPFRDQYREFGELVMELNMLRDFNKQQEARGQPTPRYMFAEGALVIIAFERFLRVILCSNALWTDTLPHLLRKATDPEYGPLLRFEGDREEAIKAISRVRNTLLHGNYEQAAEQANSSDYFEYFRTQYPSEIESLYNILNAFATQIDPMTGKPRVQ